MEQGYGYDSRRVQGVHLIGVLAEAISAEVNIFDEAVEVTLGELPQQAGEARGEARAVLAIPPCVGGERVEGPHGEEVDEDTHRAADDEELVAVGGDGAEDLKRRPTGDQYYSHDVAARSSK